LLAAAERAILDMAIYHCQQAGEKALKAFLVFWDQRVDKTHDLRLLLKKVSVIEPSLPALWDSADRLTPHATAYRYPDAQEEPALEEVEEALNDAALILGQVLAYLPGEVDPGDD